MSTAFKMFCRRLGIFFTIISFFLGIICIIGLLINSEKLTTFLVSDACIKANTIIALLSISVSLYILHLKASKKVLYLLILPLAIAAVSFTEDVLNINFGIDELIFKDTIGRNEDVLHPGRPAPFSSVMIFLIVLGIYIENLKYKAAKEIAQVILGIVTIFSFILLIGYLFNVPALQHFNFSSSVTFPTALNTFLLSISAALLNPLSGYLSLFVGNKVGNYLVRKLLLQIIAFSIFLGYLRLLAYRMNLFEPEMALCITVLTFILVVSILVSSIALKLNAMEDSRALAEEKFKLVFETTPNGILIVDTKGKIVLANQQCEELFGYNQEQFSGKSIDMLIPAAYRKNHELHRTRYINEPIKRKMGGNDDLTALHKNGYEIPVEIGLNSIKINSERLIIASIIDTTERENYQQIILAKNQQLLIKNKEVEQFAYIASHDLQEPLRTLTNYITLIKEDYPELDEQLKMYLEDMNSASERMSKLVKHLLDHSRIGTSTNAKPIDLDNCLQQAMKNLELLIQESNTEIKINGKLPEIMGHETEIERLFQNMIHNAIKFTKKDETPFVEISYTINPTTKQTEIEISDNGVGIEKKQQQNIFKMFYKGTNINNQGGYGVGLVNCKKIVELHNGKISVESIKNTGTTFKFTLG